MKNLAFHSLLRWKMIIRQFSLPLTNAFLFEKLGRTSFLSLGVKGLKSDRENGLWCGDMWYVVIPFSSGAFLIPYFVSVVLMGLVMLMLEVALGQFMGTSCVNAWKIVPLFEGIYRPGAEWRKGEWRVCVVYVGGGGGGGEAGKGQQMGGCGEHGWIALERCERYWGSWVMRFKRRPHEQFSPWQVFLDKFYLLVWTEKSWDQFFFLTSLLVEKLAYQLFNS